MWSASAPPHGNTGSPPTRRCGRVTSSSCSRSTSRSANSAASTASTSRRRCEGTNGPGHGADVIALHPRTLDQAAAVARLEGLAERVIEERRRGTETARRRYELEQRVAAGCVVAKGPRKGEPMTSQGREQLARRLVRAAIDWHTANVRRVRLLAEFNRLRAGLPEESLGPRALYALSDPWARVEARFDREEGLA